MHAKHRDRLLEYATQQVKRVRSVQSDPLHSNAFLQPLIDYLQSPFQPSKQRIRPTQVSVPTKIRSFLYRYELNHLSQPSVRSYEQPEDFLVAMDQKTPQPDNNCVIFMRGQPSPDWLNSLGSLYDLDPRFFQQHIEFLSQSQEDWFLDDTLPSHSRYGARLTFPSLASVGLAKRYMSFEDQTKWRKQCNGSVGKQLRNLSKPVTDTAGKSIVRRIDVHVPDLIVVEQYVTVHLLQQEHCWTLLCWSDAVDPVEVRSMALDEKNLELHRHFKFCPVFFDEILLPTDSNSGAQKMASITSTDETLIQPLATLSIDYGRTIDWKYGSDNPFLALEEVFRFYLAASLQCLTMLEKLLHRILDEIKLSVTFQASSYDNLTIIDSIQTSLIRYKAQYKNCTTLLETLFLAGQKMSPDTSEANEKAERVRTTLINDLQYVEQKCDALLDTCNTGRSTIMGNASAQEARNSHEEAKLVTSISKITYRLTFIFLPISYVATLFGMNFRQFGSGDLNLWIWAAVTAPLLVVCITVVEFGPSLLKICKELLGLITNDK